MPFARLRSCPHKVRNVSGYSIVVNRQRRIFARPKDLHGLLKGETNISSGGSIPLPTQPCADATLSKL